MAATDADATMEELLETVFSVRSVPRLYNDEQQNRNRLTVIKIWSKAPDGCFIPRQTGRLIVGRNMILTLITRQC
jgi:hypothetical protein